MVANSVPVAAHKFEALDGLRALAALAVVNLHLRGAFTHHIPQAFLAVDFFFVLSGFVLAHAYEDRLREGLGFVEFMARRYIRLWPLYALALAIAVAFEMTLHPSRGSVAVYVMLGLAFLPQGLHVLSPFGSATLVAPAWSLSMELAANAIYAAIARFLSNTVLAGILVLSGLFLTAVWSKAGTLDVGAKDHELVQAMARVMWSFFAGVAVYRIWLWRPARKLPLASPAAALCLMFLVQPELIWALVGFPIVVYVAASAQPTGIMRSVCLRLGSASYAIYVLHWPINEAVRRFVGVESPWVTVGVMAFLVPLALVLDRFYDQPVRAWLTRRLVPPIRRFWPATPLPATGQKVGAAET